MMAVLIWLSGFFIGWGLIVSEQEKAMVVLMSIGVFCLVGAVIRGRQLGKYIGKGKQEDDQAKKG